MGSDAFDRSLIITPVDGSACYDPTRGAGGQENIEMGSRDCQEYGKPGVSLCNQSRG